MSGPERHRRVVELCERARSLNLRSDDPGLVLVCDSDVELAAEVGSLLRCDSAQREKQWRPLAGSGRVSEIWREAQANGTLPRPERIGAYRVHGVLGRGGSGVVYRAQQESPAREVAIKVLHAHFCSEHALARFAREADVMARLKHPGIASVIEAGTVVLGGVSSPYLVMELVEGRSLTGWVRTESPTVRRRLEVFSAICEAVEAAHQRGVLHRDLKPGNILVAGEAGLESPKVLDFGLARLLDGTDGASLTELGSLLGTPAYMSPEQSSGQVRDIDTRSDVFSLGVVLFELLTGHLPFGPRGWGPQPPPIQQPSRFERECRGDLDCIVTKAIDSDPSRRFASVTGLREDVRRYLASEPIVSRRASPAYIARRWATRHPAACALGAIAVIGVVGGGSAGIWGLWTAKQRASELAAREAADARRATVLLEDVVGRIEALVGATEAREALLNGLLQDLEAQLITRPDDPALLALQAKALIYLSDVEQETRRLGASLQHRQEALAIRDDLVRQRPEDLSVRSDLAINFVKVGDLLREIGREDEGLDLYRKAFEADQAAAVASPRDAAVLDRLVWGHIRLAANPANTLQTPEAVRLLGAGSLVAQQLVELDANSWRSWHALAAVDHLRSEQARIMDAPSLELSSAAATASAKACDLAPGNRVLLEQRSAVLAGLALAKAREGGDFEADMREARSIIEAIGSQDPAQVSWRVGLVHWHSMRTQIAHAEGDHHEALTWAEQGLAFATEQFPGAVTDPHARDAIVTARMRRAECLDVLGRAEEAASEYRAAGAAAAQAGDSALAAQALNQARAVAGQSRP